ncbi:hypothetical protein [Helicobacter pylori]|nr:hypothetical protein [Helicobacter pylori]
MIDQFQAIEKMAMYFTRQITKFDALFSTFLINLSLPHNESLCCCGDKD